MTTEAFRSELAEIDQLPTLEIAKIMNGEDATVPGAVAARLPQIAAAIDDIAERMAGGAGSSTRARAPPAGWASSTPPSARRPSTRTRRRWWA